MLSFQRFILHSMRLYAAANLSQTSPSSSSFRNQTSPASTRDGLAFEGDGVGRCGRSSSSHVFLKRFESHQPKNDGKPNDSYNGNDDCMWGVASFVIFLLRNLSG